MDTDEERETIFCNNVTTARLEPEIFLAQISIFFAQPVTFEENALKHAQGIKLVQNIIISKEKRSHEGVALTRESVPRPFWC